MADHIAGDSGVPFKHPAHKDRPTAILIICMGIAVLLWLTIKLNHEYTGTLKATITFDNVPQDYMLSASSDKLIIRVRAKGFQLALAQLRKNSVNLEIDASKLPQGREYLLSSRLNAEFSGSLKNYELLDILPDTFHYTFDKKFSKQVKVKVTTDLSFEKQFGLALPVNTQPEKITVSGPKKLIADIEFWETEPIVYKNLNESKSGNIKLKDAGISGIHMEQSEVQFNIQVEEFTEKNVEVPVKAVNIPKGTEVKIFPKKITIACLVSLQDFEKVRPDLFEAVADFSQIDLKTDTHCEIRLVRVPAFVKNTFLNPGRVEFIIYK